MRSGICNRYYCCVPLPFSFAFRFPYGNHVAVVLLRNLSETASAAPVVQRRCWSAFHLLCQSQTIGRRQVEEFVRNVIVTK